MSEQSIPSPSTSSRLETLITQLPTTYRFIAESLLARSPEDLLGEIQAEQLEQWAQWVHNALLNFKKAGQPHFLQWQETPQAQFLLVILPDSPFIVRTIAQVMSDHGLRPTKFLHPIVPHQGQNYSISFIELLNTSTDQRDRVQNDLAQALTELSLMTGDFPTMKSCCQSWVEALLSTPAKSPEIAELLKWLVDDALILFGVVELKNHSGQIGARHGILHTDSITAALLQEIEETARFLRESKDRIAVTKLSKQSLAYNRSRLCAFLFRAETSKDAPVLVVLGIPSTSDRITECTTVPVVRQRFEKISLDLHVKPGSHDFALLKALLDHFPFEDSIGLPLPRLQDYAEESLQRAQSPTLHVTEFESPSAHGATYALDIPSRVFSSDLLEQSLRDIEKRLAVRTSSSRAVIDSSQEQLVRVYISVHGPCGSSPSIEELQDAIATRFRTWDERCLELAETYGRGDYKMSDFQRLLLEFPNDYRATVLPSEAVEDVLQILTLEVLGGPRVRAVRLQEGTNGQRELRVTLYGKGTVPSLSDVYPVFEHCGLQLRDLERYQLRENYLAHAECCAPATALDSLEHFRNYTAPVLALVFRGSAISDPLNAATLKAPLSPRALAVLRAYSSLLSQLNKFATRHAIYRAIADNPEIATTLWNAFDTLFNPDTPLTKEERLDNFQSLHSHYLYQLHSVSDLGKDRILRGLVELLSATVRTNAYGPIETLAIKLNTARVDFAPAPRPLFEIFVQGPRVEGVHLRSSRVSRGGIRWSERRDDYRTEIHGLMKTQNIKNTVIVPGGAKGGFILRHPPESQKLLKSAVEDAYRDYIRALLSVTDNLENGRVIHPEPSPVYDEADPYFVVAADKGTATFSDIANSIANNDFQFWLGDAFASGGSRGYDHKKYGITARGAWESLTRHAMEAGIPLQEKLDVVGIGDMSGDVFGNGLLLSRSIRLIGAFDHRHVFLDPNPDPEVSFSERARLFGLPGSQWSDYETSKISPGGGVYARSAKQIRLSAEAQAALCVQLDSSAVSGEQLIQIILRAPVDVLYNGGIGTYVKSDSESQADVNDSANDQVRVNARELRARLVVEGGNLGFTQRARVQYAQAGGRINTDALDNAGGVSLSDHEVNLKILLAEALRSGTLSSGERDQLIALLAPEMVKLVLTDNRAQALALSLSASRAPRNIEYHRGLIALLHTRGFINRHIEALPEDDELRDRGRKGEGLTRPELAVIMAGAKMWLKEQLLSSKFNVGYIGEKLLFDYFPLPLHERFAPCIKSHRLAREIAITQLVNSLVHEVGISFTYRISRNHNATLPSVVSAYATASELLGLKTIRQRLDALDTSTNRHQFLALREEFSRGLRATTAWFTNLCNCGNEADTLLAGYGPGLRQFIDAADSLFTHHEKSVFTSRLESRELSSLDLGSRRLFALIPLFIPALECLSIQQQTKSPLKRVVGLYCEILKLFSMSDLVAMSSPIQTTNRWEKELRLLALAETREALSQLTKTLISQGVFSDSEILHECEQSSRFEGLQLTLDEFRQHKDSVAALAVLGKQLKSLAEDIRARR